MSNDVARYKLIMFWTPVCVALIFAYAPAYAMMIDVLGWGSRDTSHGPLVLILVGWLIWQARDVFEHLRVNWSSVAGWLLLVVGCLMYALGYSQGFFFLLTLSQLPVLAGIVFLTLGKPGWRKLWFPVLFLFFLVPLPGSAMDPILLPLKATISSLVSNTLFLLGYPITNHGVIIYMGGYQLMVADACSGMNTIIALTGICLLYIHIFKPVSSAHSWILLLCAPLIAYFCNFTRVMCLALVTYHVGDEAGRTFHTYAGLLELVVAYVTLFIVDLALRQLLDGAPSADRVTPHTEDQAGA